MDSVYTLKGWRVKDSEFLSWIWSRMVNVHGEQSNVDYMLRLNTIILSMRDQESEGAQANESEVVEWKNGDTAYIENCTHDEIKFIGLSGNDAVAVCECITEGRRVILDKFWVSDLLKEKPETPEQRKERERLEAAYDLYCHVSKKANRGTYTFEQFCDESLTDYKIDYLSIVDKTKYRKGE